VLPVVDHSRDVGIPWSISHELTEEVCARIDGVKQIYLLRDVGTRQIAERLTAPNPSLIDQDAVAGLANTEFVVSTEVIEQTKKQRGATVQDREATQVSLTLRVRILDIRGEHPRLLLQEVLEQEHMASHMDLEKEYALASWGTEAFSKTSMGQAHSRLVRKLCSRVQSYIEAAR